VEALQSGRLKQHSFSDPIAFTEPKQGTVPARAREGSFSPQTKAVRTPSRQIIDFFSGGGGNSEQRPSPQHGLGG